jgi:hypothetical protein
MIFVRLKSDHPPIFDDAKPKTIDDLAPQILGFGHTGSRIDQGLIGANPHPSGS